MLASSAASRAKGGQSFIAFPLTAFDADTDIAILDRYSGTVLNSSTSLLSGRDVAISLGFQPIEVPMRRVPSHENHVGVSEKLRNHAHFESGHPRPCGRRQD